MQRPEKEKEKILVDTTDTTDTEAFRLAFPPPFHFEESPLLDPSLKYVPGKIIVGKTGELLLKYLTFRGVVADQIANYDNFVLTHIPEILNSRMIKIGDDMFVKFSDPYIVLPRDLYGEIVLPRKAREQKMTYSFSLYVNLVLVNTNGLEYEYPKSGYILLGSIPSMLGSVTDHLRMKRMNNKQLLQIGECIQDPFGYFIVNGIERIVLIQEKLRGNRILVFNDRDGDPNCQITSISAKGSTVVNIHRDNNGGFRLFYSLLSTKRAKTPEEKRKNIKTKPVETIGIFEMLYILIKEYNARSDEKLMDLTLEQILHYLLSYTRENWQHKVLMILIASYQKDETFITGDYYRDIYLKSKIKKRWNYKLRKLQEKNPADPAIESENPEEPKNWKTTKAEILKRTMERLFSHIDYDEFLSLEDIQDPAKSRSLKDKIFEKIVLLSIMIARLAEHVAGFRSIDSRDDWSNKRLVTGGAMMGQLFRQLWNDMVDVIEMKIKSSKKYVTLEMVAKMVKSTIITSGLERSFVPNNWGAPGTNAKFRTKQPNVTDTLDRGQSILAAQSHLSKINTPTNRKDKNANVRAVQISQLGYIDIVDTPSSDAVGLSKFKALTCWISVNRSQKTVWDLIKKKFVSPQYTENNQNLLFINGRPSGRCNAKILRTEVLRLRRRLDIDFDITVVIDNNILYIYTDGSRPTRPLLIVGDNDVPLIVERDMWGSDFKTLLRGGIVEYVDPWENQLHNVIAPSIERIALVREDLALNRNFLDQSETKLERLTQELLYNPRPNVTKEDIKHKIEKMRGGNSRFIIPQEKEIENWLNASSNVMAVQQEISTYQLNITRLLKKKYTHVEMDPNAVLGVTASAIPHITNNPGPRNNFQCSMFRQAIGINNSNPAGSYATTDKYLAHPARPLSGTQMQRLLGLDSLPAGNTIILAIMTTGTNEEDAITVKKEALERGLFTYTVLHSYNTVLKKTTGETETRKSTTIMDFLVKPTKPFPGHTISNYSGLNDRGIGEVDTVMSPGDCLIGVIRVIMEIGKSFESARYEDVSIYLHAYEEGIVDSVLVAKTPEKELSVTVRIRTVGRPILGDKLALRSAQKSVIGGIVPERFLPFTSKGIVPDIILNPHSLPTRMTISTIIELVTSKYAAEAGERINSTAFKSFELDSFTEMLTTMYGYSGSGTEPMTNPISGEIFPAEIFIGPSYYQLLKHQVQQKYQARSTGPVNRITGDAITGRKFHGGIRFGEMERDAIIAHGGSHFLRERLLGGQFKTAFCSACKVASFGNLEGNEIRCGHCKSQELLVCNVPGTFRSLMNFVASIGIKITPRVRRRMENMVSREYEEGEFEEEFVGFEEEEFQEEEFEEEEEEFEEEEDFREGGL